MRRPGVPEMMTGRPGRSCRQLQRALNRLMEVVSQASTSCSRAPTKRASLPPMRWVMATQSCLFQLPMRSQPHSSTTTCGHGTGVVEQVEER